MLQELFGDIGAVIFLILLVAVAAFLIYIKVKSASKAKQDMEERGIFAELAGVHWYGLPANESAKVFIDLSNAGIAFRAKNGNDILSITKEQIIAVSSRSEREIISSITKGTTKGGVGAAAVGGALLGPAGLVAGAVVGKKRNQSETKNKTKNHLYFVLKSNTQYGEIALEVKSKGKLRHFVDMCNSALLR